MALDEILGCLAHEAQVIAVGGLEGPSEREHQAREASIFSMCERIRASRLRGFDDAFRTAPLLLRARTAHRIRGAVAMPPTQPTPPMERDRLAEACGAARGLRGPTHSERHVEGRDARLEPPLDPELER